MNILDQFEQVAYQRLSENGRGVKISSTKISKINGKYYYEIFACIGNKTCWGLEESQGLAIDSCIKSLSDYEESAERVQLQSE